MSANKLRNKKFLLNTSYGSNNVYSNIVLLINYKLYKLARVGIIIKLDCEELSEIITHLRLCLTVI